MTNVNDNRDDTTPPGNGPYGEPQAQCERTHWEPYPLYEFQMPPVREHRPQFVPVQLCRRVLDSIGQSDLEFAEAIEALATFLDGGPNTNSGARAPIQGEGE